MKNINQILTNLRRDREDKIVINMFDASILADSYIESCLRCGDRRIKTGESPVKPNLISYVKNQKAWDGITYFTDKTFHLAKDVESDIKVAWIIEPRALLPYIYESIAQNEEYFDLIYTYDETLIKNSSDKYKFYFCDTVNIDRDSVKIHEKNKLVSMVVSEKTWLFGHRLRHIIMKSLIPSIGYKEIDFYGNAANNYIDLKSDSLNEYMFQIAIENDKKDFYFTEKIYDCFATATIPIYWGAPNIGDFFDINGILTFNTPKELESILDELTPEKYYSMMDSVKRNYEKVIENHLNPDDVLFEKVLHDLRKDG
jgi:hypothetical protein